MKNNIALIFGTLTHIRYEYANITDSGLRYLN